MSSSQQRGRGGGGSRGDDRGAPRGGQSRGGRGDNSGRGRGRGGQEGGPGREGGGPPGVGESSSMAMHGGRPESGRGGRGTRGDRGGRSDRGGRGGRGGGGGAIYLNDESVPAFETGIMELENELAEHTKGKTIDGFPGRSGYGSKGEKIALYTNYFRVTSANEAGRSKGEQTFYRYDVNTSPEIMGPKKRRLLAQIVQHPMLRNKNWATDYSKIIVTTEKLDFGERKEWKEKVTLRAPNASAQPSQQDAVPNFVQQARSRNTFNVAIQYVSSYNVRELVQYLKSTSAGGEYAGTEDLIQLLNIILCKPPSGDDRVANVGQNKFYPLQGHILAEISNLGEGLLAHRGYFSSVRPTIGRILLNLNVSSGAFYKPIELRALIGEFHGGNEQRETFLEKLQVRADYVKNGQKKPFMSKVKTIVSYAKELNPPTFHVPRGGNARQVTFQFTDPNTPGAQPREVSVYDYFRDHHGITLQYPNESVLNVGTPTDPQYMPPEICTVLPGQPYRRLLQSNQTSQMITFAARQPNLNAMSIAGTANHPGNGLRLFQLAAPQGNADPQSNSVQPWGIRVGSTMITVPGRRLDSPKIQYLNKPASVTKASWNLMGAKFQKPGRFSKWKVLTIGFEATGDRARHGPFVRDENGEMPTEEAMFNSLGRSLSSYGINMGTRAATHQLHVQPLVESNRSANNETLKKAFEAAKREQVQILFIVLPAFDRWLYARIKFYGDCQFGIHTIGAVGSKLQSPRGQGKLFGNLALKFNVKGGGTSHSVTDTLMEPFGTNTILFGIDVTHPSPGSSEDAPSIACVVANNDRNLFQWPGSIRIQQGRLEMVQGLDNMVQERLKLWQRKNGRYPNKVVVYRDGVSEGQFKLVLEHELPAFQAAFKALYGEAKNWPPIAIIIVGKRHHTRFYPTREADADTEGYRASWNPLPGTVVDRGIVNKIWHEFYLQAHEGLQGTVKPAKYSVIKDDIHITADQLEDFTHKLCYHFVRCTKAVSICPPAYYADLLAERGRAYLFSTLQENRTNSSRGFNINTAEWRGGVHPNLAESTWYI